MHKFLRAFVVKLVLSKLYLGDKWRSQHGALEDVAVIKKKKRNKTKQNKFKCFSVHCGDNLGDSGSSCQISL